MEYNIFLEKWNDRARKKKINLYNDYAREYNTDNEIFAFDEEFFYIFFSSPIDAVRATFFGKIESWNDEYIKFNGYGNLESLSDYEAENLANDYVDEIYQHDEIWMQYIDE